MLSTFQEEVGMSYLNISASVARRRVSGDGFSLPDGGMLTWG